MKKLLILSLFLVACSSTKKATTENVKPTVEYVRYIDQLQEYRK